MTEGELSSRVRKLCDRLGVFCHWSPVAAAPAGWPDLVLWRSRLIVRELKSERGRLSAAQVRVIAALRTAGVDAGVWRPADLEEGRIEEELLSLLDPARQESCFRVDL